MLTGTLLPVERSCDMHLARRMYIAQERWRQYRNRILHVVDVRDMQVGIDIVCKCLVANARKTVEDGAERRP